MLFIVPEPATQKKEKKHSIYTQNGKWTMDCIYIALSLTKALYILPHIHPFPIRALIHTPNESG